MRKLVTAKFNDWLRTSITPRTIAVVGGDSNEPELEHLTDQLITFYGFENVNEDARFRKFDLNSDQSIDISNEKYDLVLCSQVIEHLYDLPRSIEAIAGLVKPGGHLWLGFPSSNFPHGSPEYFSAGYPFQTVAKLLPSGYEVVFGGQLGSKRNYLWIHSLREWPTVDELNQPIRFIWQTPASLPRKFVRTFRRFRQAQIVFSDNTICNEIDWATESYMLVQNSNN
jgi:SAM-dependent methyltransferase